MVLYRRAWLGVVMVVVVCGVVAAAVLAPPTLVILFAAMGAVAGAAVALEVTSGEGRHRTAARAAGCAAIAVAATAGVVALAGPPGLVLAGLLALTWPPVVSRIRASSRSDPVRAPSTEAGGSRRMLAALDDAAVSSTPAEHPAADPRFLSDTELCFAWRRSFTALQRDRHPLRCAEVVRVRAGYLDELERRHPEAFKAWLDGGARAGSDPARYLTRTRPS